MIESGKEDLTKILFSFSNFNTPWSARDIKSIDIRTFENRDCSGDNFQSYAVLGTITVQPGQIPAEDCEVSSSDQTLGYDNSDNTLTFSFKPKTSMSKSGAGIIRLYIPSRYELG